MRPDEPPAWRKILVLEARIRRANVEIAEERGRHKHAVARLYTRIARAAAELATLQGDGAQPDPAPAGADPTAPAGP